MKRTFQAGQKSNFMKLFWVNLIAIKTGIFKIKLSSKKPKLSTIFKQFFRIEIEKMCLNKVAES